MMRPITLLSSTVAITMASDSVPSNAQQLWYPDFASDYESGSCTTSPSPAVLAFASGAVSPDMSNLAQDDKESCCETWFPDQELCGCLGGCVLDENDASPTPAVTELAEEHKYWYPKFDVTYEAGMCVKAGVNTDEVPPNYYTKEGQFLHATMEACCEVWFESQEGQKCLTAMDQVVATLLDVVPVIGMNSTTMFEPLDAYVHYETSRSALAAEESR
mmetsp:Transcript_5796/g.12684  ORF Transcript_5796/g.12684 Transcript_5796/m.12684 type:complete len:217 (+) Transcript_5796:61-711(+)